VSAQGIRTVALLEFRLRLRTHRWRAVLAAAVVLPAVFAAVARIGFEVSAAPEARNPGTTAFGGLAMLLLAVCLLVVPALTATSVNGDRERGLLAPLQVTLLTPAEIVLGRLVAAWGVVLLLLAAALPSVAATMEMGGVPLARAATALAAVAVLACALAAVALWLSAVCARSTASVAAAYAVIGALTVGTAAAGHLTTRWTHTNYDDEYATWQVYVPNPFVTLAYAAPYDHRFCCGYEPFDPLRSIRERVDDLQVADYGDDLLVISGLGRRGDRARSLAPYGLAAYGLLGTGSVLATVRRLRTPARTLPEGVRVA
jgi:ABC-2 type transport system permease protein